jgi:hypothetical protein
VVLSCGALGGRLYLVANRPVRADTGSRRNSSGMTSSSPDVQRRFSAVRARVSARPLR